jgi:hypothetical protein
MKMRPIATIDMNARPVRAMKTPSRKPSVTEDIASHVSQITGMICAILSALEPVEKTASVTSAVGVGIRAKSST